MKHGQSVEESMLREIKEEYDADPLGYEFLGYFDAFREQPGKGMTHWLALCFAVHVDSKQVKINEPEMVDDYGWYDLENLPNPLHSQFGVFMEKHGAALKKAMQK